MRHLLIYLLLSIIAVLITVQYSFAQNLNYINYNTNNSKLPHDIGFGMHQDDNGYIWIGTDDGLVRFDGIEMKLYYEGFLSKYVINSDQDGDKLWISTWKGGVHYIDLKKDSVVPVKSIRDHNFSFNSNRIIAHQNLIVVYSFNDYTVYKFDEQTNTIKAISLQLKPNTTGNFTVYPGYREYYRFAEQHSNNSLLAYNSTGIYKVVNFKLQLYTDKICPDEIWESPQKKLYYRKGNKIYKTDSAFSSSKLIYSYLPKQFKGQHIFDFRVLPSGNICLGFLDAVKKNNLLYYLVNPQTGEIFNLLGEVSNGSMLGWMMIDKEGSIWMSTDGNGIFHIFDKKYKFLSGEHVFKNSHITDLLTDQQGKLYIGTKKGIYTYDKNKVLNYIDLPVTQNDYVKKFFLTAEGEVAASAKSAIVWVSSYVVSVPFSERKRLPYQERYAYKNYTIFIGDYATPVLKDRSEKIKYDITGYIPSYDVEEDNRKQLWLGTPDGVYCFNPGKGSQRYQAIDSCRVNDLLYQEGKGMWVGSNNGLYLITPDMRCKHWGTNEGLSNLNINCLYVQSPNSLWIGTQNGLFNLLNDRIYVYKKRDGLLADDVKCFAPLSSNELAVGSSKGISFFYMNTPQQVFKNKGLQIEEILVNGEKYPSNQAISMSYNSSLSVNYNLITFVYPELVSFEYKLNKDDQWIRTKNKSLIFSNLQPGKYDLQIRARKYNSSWEKPVLLSFSVIPLWYQTLWFKILSAVVFISLVYSVFRWRVNNIRKIEKEKTLFNKKINQLEGNALANQMNPHFIFNSLNTVQQFILEKEEEQGLNYLNDFSLMIRQMLKYSRQSAIDISEEIVFLQRYMELEKIRFNNRFSFHFNIDPEIYHMDIKIPPMLIQPLLENAVKYGQMKEQGYINMIMESDENMLTVEIDDNGYGINSTKNGAMKKSGEHESTALKVIESRLKLLYNAKGENGTIKVVDKSELDSSISGTKIIIQIPLLN